MKRSGSAAEAQPKRRFGDRRLVVGHSDVDAIRIFVAISCVARHARASTDARRGTRARTSTHARTHTRQCRQARVRTDARQRRYRRAAGERIATAGEARREHSEATGGHTDSGTSYLDT